MDIDGEAYIREVEQQVGQRIALAAVQLAQNMRTNIGVQGTRKTPNKPGAFPKRQTGALQSSVFSTFEQSTLTARIGTLSAVGKFLEGGTSRMAARPWVLRTAKEAEPMILNTVLGSRFTGSIGG